LRANVGFGTKNETRKNVTSSWLKNQLGRRHKWVLVTKQTRAQNIGTDSSLRLDLQAAKEYKCKNALIWRSIRILGELNYTEIILNARWSQDQQGQKKYQQKAVSNYRTFWTCTNSIISLFYGFDKWHQWL
jgi:hypothetical protein